MRETEKKYLKWYQKIAYGAGDLASNTSYGLVSSFVLLYLSDTMGLNTGIIGTLMKIAAATLAAAGLVPQGPSCTGGENPPFPLRDTPVLCSHACGSMIRPLVACLLCLLPLASPCPARRAGAGGPGRRRRT